jgi:chaperonin GroEL
MMTMLRNSEIPFTSAGADGMGTDLKTGEVGDMIQMGIVDPTLVTKSALRNAVSVASTILSTKTIIHNVGDFGNAIIGAKKLS